jgi:predicted GNAT family N-acyltransferase
VFRTPEAAVDAFHNIASFYRNQRLLQQTPPPLSDLAEPDTEGARLLIEGGTGKIGRVCVLAEARGEGIGAALIRAAVADLAAMPGVSRAKLGAQVHALGFYERLGFVAVGPVYLDAGIEHRDMVLGLSGTVG